MKASSTGGVSCLPCVNKEACVSYVDFCGSRGESVTFVDS